MHMYVHPKNICDGPTTDLLSPLCILIEILLCAHTKGEKSCGDFKFGTVIGGFPSDGMASMTVKRLMLACMAHLLLE